MTSNIRPLTLEDVIRVRGEPFPQTTRGVAVDVDGELAAIAAVLHTKPFQVYSETLVEPKKHPMTVMRAVKALKPILDSYSAPIYAVADKRHQNAPAFLQRIGFEYVETNETGMIYRWRTQ